MLEEDYLLENNPYGYAEDRIECMNEAMFSFAEGYAAIFKYAFLLLPLYLVVVAFFVLYKTFWFSAFSFANSTKGVCFDRIGKKNRGKQILLEILFYPMRILSAVTAYTSNLLMLLFWGLLWLVMLPFGTYSRERERRYKKAFGEKYKEKMKNAPAEPLFFRVRWDV